jgi:hypothetical protein
MTLPRLTVTLGYALAEFTSDAGSALVSPDRVDREQPTAKTAAIKETHAI